MVREANYHAGLRGHHHLVPHLQPLQDVDQRLCGLLQKPYCHFATQYNREIPNEEIDMDFMNLNQAAHGDREHGFIGARLRMPRKIIAGYWQDEKVLRQLGDWMRAAVGVAFSQQLKVMRFGDNMREVAVTEGDKVEVQVKLGWQVNTWPVGDAGGGHERRHRRGDRRADERLPRHATTLRPTTSKPCAIRRARRSP